MSCYVKDKDFAGCKVDCKPGSIDSGPGSDRKPWNCHRLGGSLPRIEYFPAQRDNQVAGMSLYCFVVVTTAEHGLLNTMRDKNLNSGMSFYKCEANSVFDGRVAKKAKRLSPYNVDIFLKVWDQLRKDGRFRDHDWTVKLNPDAVFFPARLKQHLGQLRPPAETALYIKNTNFRYGFTGSLEILSKKAVEVYLQNKADCSRHLSHDGGEDFFLMSCLDASGVGHMRDDTLLNDKLPEGEYDMMDTSPCKKAWTTSFHLNETEWMDCFSLASK